MGQAQTRPKFRNRIKNSGPSKSLPPAAIQLRMEGWLEDDLADDLQSVSFSSATTTTTAYGGAAVNRSNSSSSDNLHHAAASASGHGSSPISAADLRLIRRLGAGDIGAVYLAELKSSKGVFFAVKLMDRKELAGRRKENRARTERELLKLLDHPFLPTLYASFDSANFSGLLTEFCPGGDLHVLRQKQPAKRFDEAAVRYIFHSFSQPLAGAGDTLTVSGSARPPYGIVHPTVGDRFSFHHNTYRSDDDTVRATLRVTPWAGDR